jgi:hypothetical protein
MIKNYSNPPVLVDLIWWTSREAEAWPMLVVQRGWKTTPTGMRYMLVHEVRLDRLESAWSRVKAWDETAERFGPSVAQHVPVILESPYRGGEPKYKRYLERCIADSIARGEAPFASHKMYTDALDDAVPDQRELGMALGFAWRRSAVRTVVYEDYGVSAGMEEGLGDAAAIGQDVDRRLIGKLEEE